MRTFGPTVSTRVVPRYLDVSDVVLLFQVGERFDECRPIVGNDLAKSTPSAQYVFEDPISDGLRSFCVEGMIFGEVHQGAVALYKYLKLLDFGKCMVSMYILANKGCRHGDYQRNKDVRSLAKLTYVTDPNEPCNVGREVRPPKAVNDVCSCGKVSVMSSGIVSSSKNCWLSVAIDDYFMTTLQIPLPKMAIPLEEVFSIAQESGVCSIGESWRTFSGLKPFTNMSQIVIGAAGSIGSGEKVIGEQWFVGDGVRDVCQGWSPTWNLQFEWVEKVHEPIDLVNPIVELRVFCRFSTFIGRLLRLLRKAIGAMLSTRDVNKGEGEQKDGDNPTIHAGGQGEVRIC